MEALGGQLSAGATWDGSNVGIAVSSIKLEPALAIVADAVRRPAFAQAGDKKPSKPAKVKVITIEEENVEGDVPTGQIIPVDARSFSKGPSLIRIRHSFVDKILAAAESV